MSSITDLRMIYSFIFAAETHSFTQAARLMELTPSAVSKNVSALEESLGVRLFNRTTRSVSLTPEGVCYLGTVKSLVNQFEQLNRNIGYQKESNLTGLIRISTDNFMYNELEPLFTKFMAQNPNITLEIDCQNQIIDFVKDGYDFAIRCTKEQDSSLVTQALFTFSKTLVATPTYFKIFGVPKNYKDLNHHRFLIERLPNGEYAYPIFKNKKNQVVTIKEGFYPFIVRGVSQLEACLNHLGLYYTNYWEVAQYIEDGELVEVLANQINPAYFEMAIQFPQNQFQPLRVRKLIALIRDYFKTENKVKAAL